jgi:hypothetical protein
MFFDFKRVLILPNKAFEIFNRSKVTQRKGSIGNFSYTRAIYFLKTTPLKSILNIFWLFSKKKACIKQASNSTKKIIDSVQITI